MTVETKATLTAAGARMAYVESGSGRPILMLHGNPTSSFLWRDVEPALEPLGRCVRPDLIGMGDSEKLPEPSEASYSFKVHERYLDAFIDAAGITENVVLVIHDWGSALGFSWARRNPERVAAIAYMEAIVAPIPSWDDFNEQARPLFEAMRAPAGEEIVLDKNSFVERILPGSILRDLSEAEMAEYRRPFPTREDRWPTLAWPRQIPIGGEPADVAETVAANAAFMAQAPFPKLFVSAEPGAILIGRARELCRSWPNQEEITVKGAHFIQEDSGPEIGAAIADWITRKGI